MLIRQYQSKFLDEETLARVEKLFRTSMRKYGPEITLLLKKIIMVAMWIEYSQQTTDIEKWINFLRVLKRNEDLIIRSISKYWEEIPVNKETIERQIRKINGCNGYVFFGLDGETALQKSLDDLERDIINYCNLTYELHININ